MSSTEIDSATHSSPDLFVLFYLFFSFHFHTQCEYSLIGVSNTLSPCCKPPFSAGPPGTVQTRYAKSRPSAPVFPPTTLMPKPRATHSAWKRAHQQREKSKRKKERREKSTQSNVNRQRFCIFFLVAHTIYRH